APSGRPGEAAEIPGRLRRPGRHEPRRALASLRAGRHRADLRRGWRGRAPRASSPTTVAAGPSVQTLEPQIERREAELGAAEHGGRLLEIVARVGADRMDVTPGPLDRVVEKDSAATAGFAHAHDGAHTAIRPLGGIPPITRPLGE